jgi:hypothetical protein
MTASRRAAAALLAALVVCASAASQGAPPPPAGQGPQRLRPITPRLAFRGLGDHPGYDFFVIYGHGAVEQFLNMYVTRVQSDVPVSLEGFGRRITPVYLLAVPKGKSPPVAPQDEPQDLRIIRGMRKQWFERTRKAYPHSSPLPGIEDDGIIDEQCERLILIYQVGPITGDDVSVMLVESKDLPPWPQSRDRPPISERRDLERLLTALVWIDGFLIVMAASLWVARRRR